MEQKCKIGGESLRNRDAVNKDRISELPEDLLRKILSSLPARTVIATSVLSKRWLSLWKMVPNLKFVSDHHVKHTSSDNVYKTLILHKAPFLESFHLMIEDEGDCLDIGILIGIAFARNLRELVLGLFIKDDKLVTFPSVLFSCNNTLETLTLDGCILLDFPSRVCFKSLRKLHLDYVEFKDEESVCNLLCGCPSLQDLYVRPNGNISVTTFTIAVPSLQRLTIEDDYVGEGDGGYVISAPSLRYLSIKGVNNLEFCLIENAPELLEAKVIDASNISNENILASLTSAKCLTLSSIEIKYPTGSIFYQLVSLEIGIDKSNWWNLLPLMLDSSPKLQILKLIDPSRSNDKDLVGWKWIQPKCVPECLLLHLETFVWTRYEWQREDEKEVAMYILKNARRLKKATLSTKPIEREELQKLKRRCKMLEKLAREVMASISCDRKSSIVRNSVSCGLKSSMVRNSVSCSLVLESN